MAKKASGGQIPLTILQKRLVILQRIVDKRRGIKGKRDKAGRLS